METTGLSEPILRKDCHSQEMCNWVVLMEILGMLHEILIF